MTSLQIALVCALDLTRIRGRLTNPQRLWSAGERLVLVQSSFGKTYGRHDPLSTAAAHALPRVFTDVCSALWTLETAFQLTLFQLLAHPRERIEEVV